LGDILFSVYTIRWSSYNSLLPMAKAYWPFPSTSPMLQDIAKIHFAGQEL